ncbi:hypothetical protein ACFFX1_18840 [Dactylosporangium sucinum]|uniref:Uncharacterized protein n=1 Tax=Dactylosporangium sucinum TaxID=1424081 RepID=A0A917X0C9_9ACTN|nr:hypothetical protein [Dactylosporangium sucinum]GGM46734.1 hypothetical protein GCM10007977_055560 [Dactylosporangium sucinum]
MDLAWLAQVGMTGAAALVQAVATDGWQLARDGFARLLGRGDPGREGLAGQRLDALAAEVEQAPADQRDEVRRRLLPAWQTRLTDLVEEDPALAEALVALRDEVLERLPAAQQQWVQHITASAPGATAQGVMFGNIINHPGPPTA